MTFNTNLNTAPVETDFFADGLARSSVALNNDFFGMGDRINALGTGTDFTTGIETAANTTAGASTPWYKGDFTLGFNDRINALGTGTGLTAGADTPWYKDSETIGAYAGLGSALASLAALPSAIKYANTQTKMLEHNLKTARVEQARRNKNIASFNAVDTSQYA